MVQMPDKQFKNQHQLLLQIRLPVEQCQLFIQGELPAFVIAPCHLPIVVRKWDIMYASVSCHHEITRHSNYCNYLIYSDDTDVTTLLFFLIYDAIVTQGASIKDYTNVKANRLCDI